MWDSMCFRWKESPCNCHNSLTLTSAMVWPAELKCWATGCGGCQPDAPRNEPWRTWSEPLPSPPTPHPLICREYLPVLEVSGERPGKKVFQELSSSVLHWTHYVSPLTWKPISVALWHHWMLPTARPTHRHINLAPTFRSSWGAWLTHRHINLAPTFRSSWGAWLTDTPAWPLPSGHHEKHD